jgi:hypothetical protein
MAVPEHGAGDLAVVKDSKGGSAPLSSFPPGPVARA